MNLTVGAISSLTFLAVFMHDHLISKRHVARDISFFGDFENLVALIFLVVFAGLFGGVLAMPEEAGLFSSAHFSDANAFDAGKGFVFGISAFKLVNGNPTTNNEGDPGPGADDTGLKIMKVPVWRRFVVWRNA